MKILAVDHITINLAEPEKSFEFYENVLGLKKDQDIDMGDHILHLYWLTGSEKLELIEYKDPQKRVSAGNTDIGVYRHFAVVTDDIRKAEEACEKAGYGINMSAKYVEQIGKIALLVRDPNGVEIEILQEPD